MTESAVGDQPRRGGFWRRVVAVFVDFLIVSVPLQILVAVLFVQTNGYVHGNFGLVARDCQPISTLPAGFQSSVPNINFAEDCRTSFFGFDTSRRLLVGNVQQDGAVTKSVTEQFFLDAQGQLTAPDAPFFDVGGIALGALAVYFIFMEWRWGRTLGKRLMRVRVFQGLDSTRRGIPILRAVSRFLAKFIGAIPMALVAAVATKGGDAATIVTLMDSSNYWKFLWGAYSLGTIWIIWNVVLVARKRDALYDRIVGTAVIRT